MGLGLIFVIIAALLKNRRQKQAQAALQANPVMAYAPGQMSNPAMMPSSYDPNAPQYGEQQPQYPAQTYPFNGYGQNVGGSGPVPGGPVSPITCPVIMGVDTDFFAMIDAPRPIPYVWASGRCAHERDCLRANAASLLDLVTNNLELRLEVYSFLPIKAFFVSSFDCVKCHDLACQNETQNTAG